MIVFGGAGVISSSDDEKPGTSCSSSELHLKVSLVSTYGDPERTREVVVMPMKFLHEVLYDGWCVVVVYRSDL